MFTTEVSTRVLLTVLLVGPFGGLCNLQQGDQNEDTWARTGETKSDESDTRLLSSLEAGILLPPDDKYNFVGEDSSTTQQSTWRTGRNSPFPATTIVSTNSYSIRPGGSSPSDVGSGSSIFINAKPLTIVTTGKGYKGQPQSPYSNSKGNYDGSFYSPNSKNNDKSTVYVKNNCYGSRCPTSSNRQDYNDENKSYHYVMNKDAKQKLKRYNEGPVKRNGEYGESPVEHQMTLSLPFRVEPALSQKDLKYPSRFPNQNRNNRRFSRTTTTTPGWVKLAPIFPDQYDLFSINTNKNLNPYQQVLEQNSTFSKRFGIELNPESFADRWGWGGDSYPHHHDKGSGSRLPSWLQQIHSSLKGGPTRDSDNKNWVKLDPIPVAGVSISKWVQKGTPSSELPSTNWPTRDHRPNSNGGNFGSNVNNYNHNKWYDHIDSVNKLSRPSYLPPPVALESHQGWGPNKHSHPQSSSWDRTPTNQWSEVVYPDGPTSATANWQHDKDLSKYPSSFTVSTPSSSQSWPSDIRRPGTGSWSADRDRSGPNRRHGSNSYPNVNNQDNDSRWVLVSNSRKVSVSPSESQRHPDYNDGPQSQYRPEFDKFSDFPFYYENPHGHRVGKDVKSNLRSTISNSKPDKLNQDDAFNRINATLSNLTPVLSTRGVSTSRPSSKNKIRSSSTTKAPKKLPAFMKPYAGNGRGNNDVTRFAASQTVRINPVFAAVGSLLGRKRRDVQLHSHNLPKSQRRKKSKPSLPLTFLDYDSSSRSQFLMSKPRVSNSNLKKAPQKSYLFQI